MSSTAKLEANRANARKSTGPRTEQGKRESARNAVKHGLTARHLVLSIEEQSDFDQLRSDLIAEHQPAGTQEFLLVTQIADAFWRLQRIRSIETATIERQLDVESADPEQTLASAWEREFKQLELLRRYEAAAERAYYRALAALRQSQADRRKLDRERAVPAAISAAIGFVSQPAPNPPAAAPKPAAAAPKTTVSHGSKAPRMLNS
jgi:hypothetical protein